MTDQPQPRFAIRRFFQFSTRLLLAVMLILGFYFAYQTYRNARRDRTREYTRLIASYELMQVHGSDGAMGGNFVAHTRSIIKDDFIHRDWSFEFLLPSPAAPSTFGRNGSSDEERSALAEISHGKDEVWRTTADGETTYYRAIRGASCATCHHAPDNNNGLLGVAKVELTQRKKRD